MIQDMLPSSLVGAVLFAERGLETDACSSSYLLELRGQTDSSILPATEKPCKRFLVDSHENMSC